MITVRNAVGSLLNGNGKKWLIWLGVAGVALIALTELVPTSRGGSSTKAEEASLSARQVEQALEERITALLERVEGVGACRVMVTLENGVKTVYAANTVSSSSTGTEGADASSSSEQILTVQTDKGLVGLRLTDIQPVVRGVAVVCDGGGNPSVQEQVTQLVATAFHISSRRVCVVKQK